MWLFAPIMLVSIFMRRRGLARAAVVGGVAYHAGKRRQEGQMREEEQEARLQDLEGQQQAAPAAAPQASGGMSQDAMDKLKQLAELHEQGVLTDAEFEVQKQKILQGM
jgi:cytosine/adenosine deaminase-related metal-dependent hydrolase